MGGWHREVDPEVSNPHEGYNESIAEEIAMRGNEVLV